MKYPRTFHLPFSPEKHSDDKTIETEYLSNFIGKEIVITEKLDGSNCRICKEGVFARSQTEIVLHPSFDIIKTIWANIQQELSNISIYGENMYAIHSILYNKLPSPFFVFAMEQNGKILSWNDTENISPGLGLNNVPVVFKGIFSNIAEIQKFLASEINKPSLFGDTREGFVVRTTTDYLVSDSDKYIAKYVRKGHVQSKIHWTKNWKRATLG